MAKKHMIILYVADQERSREFYEATLQQKPLVHVPGMTEFAIAAEVLLGLMPESGIARIITPALPHPQKGNGIPRAELYLITEDPASALKRAVNAGGKMVSPASARDWGDVVAYCADPDGHILAFAK